MNVYDSARKPVTLGPEMQRGGEGAIYPVLGQGAAGIVAKLYNRTPAKDHADKLAWMRDNPPADPTRPTGHASIAWPLDLLFDQSRQFAGFTMPYIKDTAPMLAVFNPRSRAKTMPDFNWKYLHRTARNLSSALEALHASDYVVGDLNESNVLITTTALVTMIDTDSFQVRGPRHKVYYCPVGKPEYTPPELQGKSFHSLERSAAHDCFGLGVLIFQLLLDGSHPFRAQWLGAGDPPSIEERIAKGWFPYAYSVKGRNSGPVAPPPNTPGLQTLYPGLVELLMHCFVDGQRDPGARPAPGEWEKALTEAEEALVKCTNGHFFSGHLDACPRCGAANPRRTTPAAAGATPTAPAPAGQLQTNWQSVQKRTRRAPQSRSGIHFTLHAPRVTLPAIHLPASLRDMIQLAGARMEHASLPLWLGWVLATLFGWVGGAWAGSLAQAWAGPVGGSALQGIIIGLAQWLVLRHQLRAAGWWGLASVAGYGAGIAIDHGLGIAPVVGPTAILLGSAAQAIVLWKLLPGRLGPVWMGLNIIAWFLAMAASGALRDTAYALAQAPVAALITGLVTGLSLSWILRQIKRAILAGGWGIPLDIRLRLLALRVGWRGIVLASGMGLLAATLAILALRPCGELDLALKLSRCHYALNQAGPLGAIAYSADGAVLASVSSTGGLRLWRVADGALLRLFSNPAEAGSSAASASATTAVAFAANGTTLMTATNDTLQVWRPADGVRMRSQKLAGTTHWSNEQVTSAHFSADGTLLALAICARADAAAPCNNAEIRLWRTGDGSFAGALRGQSNAVSSMAFSNDGALLASGSCHTLSAGTTAPQCIEGEVAVWRMSDRKSLYTVPGHGDWVTGLAFSNDGIWLACGARDGSVIVRRAGDGGRLLSLQHSAAIKSLTWTRDDGLLAAAAPVALWQMPSGMAVDGAGWPNEATQLVVSPDGLTLAVGSEIDKVGLWRLRPAPR